MAGPLTHSPAEITQVLLQEKFPQLAIFSTNEPDAGGMEFGGQVIGDLTITVYDTDGKGDGRAMVDGTLFNHWGLQIRVRSSEHRDGWVQANTIRNFLAEGVQQAVVVMPDDSSMYLIWCYANIGQVLPLGKQTPQSKRSIFTINCTAAIRELLPVEVP
jgi:hypothetical protein